MLAETRYFNQFCDLGTQLQVSKGTDILSLDKDGKPSVYALIKGACCLSKLTQEGEEVSYIYFYPGQLMRIVSCLSEEFGTSEERFAIVAKTDCIVQQIEFGVFRAEIRKNPDLAEAVILALGARLGSSLLNQHSLYEQPASLNLCSALLKLSTPYEDGYILEPGFTYEELAKLLRLHVVTVSRIMSALRQNNVIEKRKRVTILDIERLKEILKNKEVLSY